MTEFEIALARVLAPSHIPHIEQPVLNIPFLVLRSSMCTRRFYFVTTFFARIIAH